MNLVNVIPVLVAIIGAGAQQDSLVELEFKIREERVPAIVNYLILNRVEENGIKTGDLIALSKLNRMTLEEIGEVFAKFGLETHEVFTVDNLELALKSLNISVADFIPTVINKLGVSNQLQQILTSLEIPGFPFLSAITMRDDTMVYNILKDGVYDREHIDAALEAAGKSENEVYEAARDILLERVQQIEAKEIIESLKSVGFDRQIGLIIYEALDITTRDVYDVEIFRDIFTNISDSVNRNTTLGVFVAPNRIALHEIVYDRYSNVIDGIIFKVEADGLEVSTRKDRNLGEHIVELATAGNRSEYVEIIPSYNGTRENCTYITIAQTPIDVEASREESSYTVGKNPDLKFILGSPLICDGYLAGLARNETDEDILFDIFYTEDHPPPTEPDHDDDHVSRASILVPTFFSLVFTCFVLL